MVRILHRVRNFIEKLSFTPTERNVVIALVGAFLVGLGIRFVRSSGTGAATFDYTEADSAFIRLSSNPPPGRSEASEQDASPGSDGGESGAVLPAAGSVHLNSAGKNELMSLPGVGETIAERILRYRMDHGPFTSVRDLLGVKGIGEKKLRRLAPFCIVEN